jgi:hypothetical protein
MSNPSRGTQADHSTRPGNTIAVARRRPKKKAVGT